MTFCPVSHEEASANILMHVADRALVQGDFHMESDEEEGKELACLLGAMHAEVNDAEVVGWYDKEERCEYSKIMPFWMAELTIELFDGLPDHRIYEIAERYGKLVAQWKVLSEAAWDRTREENVNYHDLHIKGCPHDYYLEFVNLLDSIEHEVRLANIKF